jgi:hypothetical protein
MKNFVHHPSKEAMSKKGKASSPWLDTKRLASVRSAPSSPTSPSPGSSTGSLPAWMYEVNYLRPANCIQVMQKHPKIECELPFKYDYRLKNAVLKSFCPIHRYCFWPEANGEKCNNLRSRVNSIYCELHEKNQPECDRMVERYKTICGRNVKTCQSGRSVEEHKQIYEQNRKCMQGRRSFEDTCIHKTVRSLGHRKHIERLAEAIKNCENKISMTQQPQVVVDVEEDADVYDDDDEASYFEDDSDSDTDSDADSYTTASSE